MRRTNKVTPAGTTTEGKLLLQKPPASFQGDKYMEAPKMAENGKIYARHAWVRPSGINKENVVSFLGTTLPSLLHTLERVFNFTQLQKSNEYAN